jgi:hypothetical protein
VLDIADIVKDEEFFDNDSVADAQEPTLGEWR